ncbi:MAG TPA: DinB family protein [Lacibacter sp.]|nr:DinB family protein [Lacibacter sp.]
MKYNSNSLIESLLADVRELILEAEQLKALPASVMHLQPKAHQWSVAQVLEHLNIYSRFYINAIEQKLHLNQSDPNTDFTPGWLGNYFTNLMKPGADKRITKKMKAPKNAVPSAQPDAQKMLEEFINHQHHLLNLLQIAKTANLDYNRIPTSLSKLISLKLGDTFRFFIAHEQRHFVQISNVMKALHPAHSMAA